MSHAATRDRAARISAALLPASHNEAPARRIGHAEDVGQAIIFLMTNPFTTGSVLHLEGGAMLV